MSTPPDVLHLVAFDHRQSLARAVERLGLPATATRSQRDLKALVWRGVAAQRDATPNLAVLVDLDSASLLDDAHGGGATTALALEASGNRWLEPGAELSQLRAELDRHRPTYAKVLMRWHPTDARSHRDAQAETLRSLFSLAAETGCGTMLELLIAPDAADQAVLGTDETRYNRELRPRHVADSVEQLAHAGLVPDVWKIDGLEDVESATLIGSTVSATSGGAARIVVLGAGRTISELQAWFATTTAHPAFCGFAIGRSIWWPAIERLLTDRIDETGAIAEIGNNFVEIVELFERVTTRGRRL